MAEMAKLKTPAELPRNQRLALLLPASIKTEPVDELHIDSGKKLSVGPPSKTLVEAATFSGRPASFLVSIPTIEQVEV